MKKAVVGLLVLGVIVGLLPRVGRRGREMREHCAQMAAQCKQMAAELGARGEAVGKT